MGIVKALASSEICAWVFGALVGGLLFRVLGLAPGLDRVAISLRDVVAAFVGSLIVLMALWIWRRYQTSR